MTERPVDAIELVPEPTPVPADQDLSADEILDFDAAATVASAEPTASEPVEPAPVGSAPAETAAAVAAGVDGPGTAARAAATCPGCGTVGAADFARREAADFCAVCDYPLFWSRERVVLPSTDAPDESALRRLPGTAGRAALASLLCPSCAEPNPATGITCVRCGAALHPVAFVVPVVEAPPPVVEVEPEPDARPWWPIILAGALAVVVLTVVLVLLYT